MLNRPILLRKERRPRSERKNARRRASNPPNARSLLKIIQTTAAPIYKVLVRIPNYTQMPITYICRNQTLNQTLMITSHAIWPYLACVDHCGTTHYCMMDTTKLIVLATLIIWFRYWQLLVPA